ncbi:MAG TPA: hypothetical protein VHH73_11385 [Verrucomicrobiae bacterium]|nr:hypothetical protein [Verrucomicrobiae bacterium]
METELRSWTPRRPSPRLKEKLFRRPRFTASRSSAVSSWTPWLAPALACCLFAMAMPGPGVSSYSTMNLASTNRLAAPASFGAAAFQAEQEARYTVDQNSVPTGHFEHLLAFRAPTNTSEGHLLATNYSGH